MQENFSRSAGILMPVSSLPSPYGIGTFGKSAYEFVDNLVMARPVSYTHLDVYKRQVLRKA